LKFSIRSVPNDKYVNFELSGSEGPKTGNVWAQFHEDHSVSLGTFVTIAIVAAFVLAAVAWVCQVYQYPRFYSIAETDFRAFHDSHCLIVGLIVGLPLLAAPIASGYVAVISREPIAWVAFALGLVGHGITFLHSAGCHAALNSAWNREVIDQLLASNLWRSIAWSLQAVLSLWLLRR